MFAVCVTIYLQPGDARGSPVPGRMDALPTIEPVGGTAIHSLAARPIIDAAIAVSTVGWLTLVAPIDKIG